VRAIASLRAASSMFCCARATGTARSWDGELDLNMAKTPGASENLLQGRCFEPRRAKPRRARKTVAAWLRAACCVLRAADAAAAAAQQRERRPRFRLATTGFEPTALDSKTSAIPLCYGVAYPIKPAN